MRVAGPLATLGILVALSGCGGPDPSMAPATEGPQPPTSVPAPSATGASIQVQADGTIPCSVSSYGCRAVIAIMAAGPDDPSPPPLIEADAIELASRRDVTDHAVVADSMTLGRDLPAGAYLVVGESQLTSDVSSMSPSGSIVIPAVGETGRCTATFTVTDEQATTGSTVRISIDYLEGGGCKVQVEGR